jgi:hypothetical protein
MAVWGKTPTISIMCVNLLRFWVHGSGFTVGRFALFIFLEIGDESTNSSTGSSSQFISTFKFAGRYVLFVQGYIKLALNFRARPFGVP